MSNLLYFALIPLLACGGGAVDTSETATDTSTLTTTEPDEIYGCTDETASNFDNEATLDDGTCLYEGLWSWDETPDGPYGRTEIGNWVGDREVDALTYDLTTGIQNTLVMLVKETGTADAMTVEQAEIMLEQVRQWYLTNSFGLVDFNFDVIGWYEGDANYAMQMGAVADAIDEGYDPDNYDRFLTLMSGETGGFQGGGSTIGMEEMYIVQNNGVGRWYTGSLCYVAQVVEADWIVFTIVHELGHSHGLSHHAGLNGISGWWDQYGSQMDTMGAGAPYQFGALFQARLGWIGHDNVVTVLENGTVNVSNVEEYGATAARVYLPPDAYGERWLWLSSREEADSHSTVVIDRVQQLPYADGTVPYPVTLDATPETQTIRHNRDSHLHPGRSWHEPSLGLTVTNIGADQSGAELYVHLSDGSPNVAPEILEVSATVDVLQETWELSLEVLASDSDGDELSYFWDLGLAVGQGQYLAGDHTDGSTAVVTLQSEPNHRVRVVVSDRRGGEIWGWVDLGNFVGEPPDVGEISSSTDGLVVTYSASNSDDEALIWTWDYGDGVIDHFREPEHEYPQGGDYDVVLTVFDGETVVKREVTVSVSE